jgi:integrase
MLTGVTRPIDAIPAAARPGLEPGTYERRGLIRHNPTHDLKLPHRQPIQDDDDEQVRAFTREQLGTVLELVHPRHRLLLEVLAATGLRISEALALQSRHLQLDGSYPI